ncbi:VanW family protein [Halobacillus locisalis]|uniref:VanW family protein n=1 Tax=Halobacillus locisalis TaxID=220753 RepID=A0A838CNM5_9BACI|nr:VanW family protein [Halobacillus locisalis]MBA2173439.1 VanW family protein [Halobacillus locisalis]
MEHAKGLGLLAGMTAFLLLFTYAGPLGWQLVSGQETVYEPNTAVAGVSIEGLERSEALVKLSEQSSDWKQQKDIRLESSSGAMVVSSDFITFDVEETLDEVVQGSSQSFVVEVDESYKAEVEEEFTTEVAENFEWEKWVAQVRDQASDLTDDPLTFSMYDYIPSEVLGLYETVATYETTVSSDPLLVDLLSVMNALPVNGQQSFSLLEAAEEFPVAISAETLNPIATVIYGAALETNFSIQQRHISQRLPEYAELGKEASVKPEQNDDFVLFNPNESAYSIHLALEGSTLSAEIRGYPFVDKYSSRVDDVQSIEPRTIVQYTSYVNPGDVELKQEGEQGQSAVVYRETRGENGLIEKMAEDYYPPLNRVELRYGIEGEDNTSGEGSDSSGGDAGSNDDTSDENTAAEGEGSNSGESSDNEEPTDSDEAYTGDDAPEVDPSNPIWEEDEADENK